MEEFGNIRLVGSGGGGGKGVLWILNEGIVNEKDGVYEGIKKVRFDLVDIKEKDRSYYDELFGNLKNELFL